jgi:hypothetical protein
MPLTPNIVFFFTELRTLYLRRLGKAMQEECTLNQVGVLSKPSTLPISWAQASHMPIRRQSPSYLCKKLLVLIIALNCTVPLWPICSAVGLRGPCFGRTWPPRPQEPLPAGRASAPALSTGRRPTCCRHSRRRGHRPSGPPLYRWPR